MLCGLFRGDTRAATHLLLLLLPLDYYLKKPDDDFHRTVETCSLIND